MKKFLLITLLAAVSLLGTVSTRAEDATNAAPAAAPAPTPTIEQRLAGLEAYIANTDPTAPLKDKDGKIPDGLTTIAAGNPGPGHNGWMMTSSALVLFVGLHRFFALLFGADAHRFFDV